MAQLLGAISEFERSLITERVRAGIRNARNKGKWLGRLPLALHGSRIHRLRASGPFLRTISKQLGVSLGSIHRALQERSNNPLVAALGRLRQVIDWLMADSRISAFQKLMTSEQRGGRMETRINRNAARLSG